MIATPFLTINVPGEQVGGRLPGLDPHVVRLHVHVVIGRI